METKIKESKVKKPIVNRALVTEQLTVHKKLIITVLVIFLISGIGVLCKVLNSSSINVNAYFAQISKGYNPDGSPYNIEEFTSLPVLERAVKKLDGKTTVESLKRHISISDNSKVQDIQKVKQSIKDGNTEYTDVPTMYVLKYSIVSDRIKSEGFLSSCGAVFEKMVTPKKKKILEAVAESYREFYTDRYIDETKSLILEWEVPEKLDYYNKAGKLEAYARRINRFITEKYDKNSIFISEQNHLGYGDLQTRLGQIISVDIENYKSFIIQNGITDNKDQLLRQMRYMNQSYEEINKREVSKYETIKEAISFYDANVTKVVFIPSLDYNNSFYMNRTKVGIDYLVDDANESQANAQEARGNSERCRYLINSFGESADASDEVRKTADKMYTEIKGKIENVISDAKVLIEEEAGTRKSEKIETGKPYISIGLFSMAVFGAKIFIVLAIIVFLLYSLYDFMKRKNIFKI